jgi:hypothetical protein
MSMISVEIGSEKPHEYANGISVGEVILNVHGKRSGAVAVSSQFLVIQMLDSTSCATHALTF